MTPVYNGFLKGWILDSHLWKACTTFWGTLEWTKMCFLSATIFYIKTKKTKTTIKNDSASLDAEAQALEIKARNKTRHSLG